ncbi:triphosphate tunnel metalloenzyme 3-like [Panicum virgatum]|uniref:triphosphate tunnel metalloenzyme 3-like n=1 Tax=Panicum virgatum TaxID=38727 RepID=UPI0019D54465|nr:triphosphate tunnel metalloenzyme 3-like [Panicum virgatum]
MVKIHPLRSSACIPREKGDACRVPTSSGRFAKKTSDFQKILDKPIPPWLHSEIRDGLAVREPRAAAARSLAVLRFHLYNPDDRAPLRVVLALKRHPCIEANISRIEEVEEPVDPALALACANNPVRLGGVNSPIVRLVADEVGVGQDTAPFVWLGEFRQTRAIYELEDGGLVLELDEMRFDFGTSYELECDGLA